MSDVLTAEEVQALRKLFLSDQGRNGDFLALARSHEQMRGRLRESEIAVYDALALLGAARNERDAATADHEHTWERLIEAIKREEASARAAVDAYETAVLGHATPAAADEERQAG